MVAPSEFCIETSAVQITQISSPGACPIHLTSSVLKAIEGKLFIKLKTREHCIQRLMTSRCLGVPSRLAFSTIQKTTVIDVLRKAKLEAIRKLVRGSCSQKGSKRFRFAKKQYQGRAMVLPATIEVHNRSNGGSRRFASFACTESHAQGRVEGSLARTRALT